MVPLRAQQVSRSGGQLAGLVVFLLDCQDNAYFATVEDDAAAQRPLSSFPPLDRSQAALQLGSGALRLEYTASPLQPRWTTLASPSRSVAAR